MLKIISSYLRNKTGSILPITALALPIVLGVTGLGVDVSMWVKNKRDLQAAADAAALAGAWETLYDFSEDDAVEAALKEATANGYVDSEGNSFNIQFGLDDEGNTMVTATLTNAEQQYFSQIISKNSFQSTVVAAAIVDTPNGDYCMLSLDPTADGAITAVGTVSVESLGCGIAVNSNSPSALDLGGTVDIDISDLSIVGDMNLGANVDLNSGSTDVNAPPVQDPYADLEPPEINYPSDCDYMSPTNISGGGTLDPGVYCKDIRITGNGNVIFNPGVYILYGSSLDISGSSGSITAIGVTFIFTGDDTRGYGDVDITGGREMTFQAPFEGDLDADYEQYEGIAFFQDRNAPDQVQCNRIMGSSAVDVFGSSYFPSRCLVIGGDAEDVASADNPCSRIIAKRITLNGTPNIGNECDGLPVEDFAPPNVRLVL